MRGLATFSLGVLGLGLAPVTIALMWSVHPMVGMAGICYVLGHLAWLALGAYVR